MITILSLSVIGVMAALGLAIGYVGSAIHNDPMPVRIWAAGLGAFTAVAVVGLALAVDGVLLLAIIYL